jgi:hypothetical protein
MSELPPEQPFQKSYDPSDQLSARRRVRDVLEFADKVIADHKLGETHEDSEDISNVTYLDPVKLRRHKIVDFEGMQSAVTRMLIFKGADANGVRQANSPSELMTVMKEAKIANRLDQDLGEDLDLLREQIEGLE